MHNYLPHVPLSHSISPQVLVSAGSDGADVIESSEPLLPHPEATSTRTHVIT